MVAKRIIPCLDVKDAQVVKGINFEGLREVGDAVEMGVRYAREGADELVYLDISASREERRTFAALVEKIALGINIPFTVGGGIGSVEDAARPERHAAAVRAEVRMVVRAVEDVRRAVVAIDAKNVEGRWLCTTHGGSRFTDRELFDWAHEAQERGAGEILFTSMDHDGTRNGYAIDVYTRLNGLLSIPVIASGGAGSVQDIVDVLTFGKADAALAASIFHYGQIPIPRLKASLAAAGVPVRITT